MIGQSANKDFVEHGFSDWAAETALPFRCLALGGVSRQVEDSGK